MALPDKYRPIHAAENLKGSVITYLAQSWTKAAPKKTDAPLPQGSQSNRVSESILLRLLQVCNYRGTRHRREGCRLENALATKHRRDRPSEAGLVKFMHGAASSVAIFCQNPRLMDGGCLRLPLAQGAAQRFFSAAAYALLGCSCREKLFSASTCHHGAPERPTKTTSAGPDQRRHGLGPDPHFRPD